MLFYMLLLLSLPCLWGALASPGVVTTVIQQNDVVGD